jgi:hypothetical protein
MDDTIEIAAGSVAGRVHRKLCRPNQDAVAWQRFAGGAVLVVCDGCGGAARSEVGAALGARLWTEALVRRLGAGESPGAALFDAAGGDVLERLGALAAAMGSPTSVVVDHFMFTTLAAVVTPAAVAIHALGDGLFALGDAVHVIGPFPDNQPPYLAQALLGSRPCGSTWVADPREVDRLAIASDGAGALVEGIAQLSSELVFRNPAALTRKLALLAEDAVEIDWDQRRVDRRAAVLDDDTTIALARWRVTS